jgi:PKD repeat protein
LLFIMKRLYFTLFIIAITFSASEIKAQSCPGNMLTNGNFSAGIATGWTTFSSPILWNTSVSIGCIDSSLFLGSGVNSGGGVEQSVNFLATHCYNLCMCLAPQSTGQFSRVRIFAAISGTGITYASLKANTYAAGTAQLIDSIDVNGTSAPAVYCKNNWVANANYTRFIIINSPQPPNLGTEVYIDNICLRTCGYPCDLLVPDFNFTVNKPNVSFTNTSTFTGGGTITTNTWNFGDGSPTMSTGNATHIYGGTSQIFTACLIVSGTIQGQTCIDTICRTINLNGINSTELEGLKIDNSSRQLAVTLNDENFNFQLIDISGKVLKELNGVKEVNISKADYDHGIYLIRIQKEGKLYSQRIAF